MAGQEIIKKAGLVFVSVLLSLFIAEVALRFVYPDKAALFVWQPYLKHTFKPDTSVFYGVYGISDFTINSMGIRGEVPDANGHYYLALGGSTTECLYLDDRETWPFLVQDKSGLSMGSIGKSGCTLRENYVQLKYYVPQIGKIEGVIFMIGLNDMMKRLSRDTLFEKDFEFTQAVEDSLANTIFLKAGRGEGSIWWRRTALFYAFQQVLHRTKKVDWQTLQDDKGEIYKIWRTNRQNAKVVIDTLPDLTNALNEYKRSLNLIYSEAHKQKLHLVFVNQSALYKDPMGAYEQQLLWMGGKGDFQKAGVDAYYSPRALNEALKLYNEQLKLFCMAKPDVKFIDLAAQLPRDTSVFYDDCHFNENGARRVAEIIAQEMAK